MPTAARSLYVRLARVSARPTTSRTFFQISSALCSTQPARGKICSCSICPVSTIWPEWSKTMARELVVPWSMARTYLVSGMVQIPPGGSGSPDGVLQGVLDAARTGTTVWWAASEVRGGREATDDATDEGAEDRDPGVRPVARALALDGQERVRDARAEVTSRVDGVAGGATEAGTDADHEQGDEERAETRGRLAGHQDDEDQHERADDLRDEVPRVRPDGRAGGEDGELGRGVGVLVEVLLVGEEAEQGTYCRAEHLCRDVQHTV